MKNSNWYIVPNLESCQQRMKRSIVEAESEMENYAGKPKEYDNTRGRISKLVDWLGDGSKK